MNKNQKRHRWKYADNSPEHTAYQAGDYRYMFQYLKLFAKKPLPVRQGHFVTD